MRAFQRSATTRLTPRTVIRQRSLTPKGLASHSNLSSATSVTFSLQPIIDLRTQEVAQQMLWPREVPPCPVVTLITLAAEIAASGEAVAMRLPSRAIGDLRHLERCLCRLGPDPARLLFELDGIALSETSSERCRFIGQLHALGCKLALDDAGTAAGSFTYLPCDYLIIDAAQVKELPNNGELIDAIVELAAGFELGTIAQGVQSDAELASLRARGVELAMGDRISPRVPLARLDPVRARRSWSS
jgi:predicted signal transduction protein with EAL and GGDEF domain